MMNIIQKILSKYNRPSDVADVARSVNDVLREVLKLTVKGHPNINALGESVRNANILRYDVKNLGYYLARELSESLDAMPAPPSPVRIGLKSKLTTQDDMQGEWVRYWCKKLEIRPIFHRKIWELCFVPQALHENLDFESKLHGIGFGCGEEPLASLFAARGHKVVVTDLEPGKVKGMGWSETGQHTASLEKAFRGNLVTRDVFDQNVSLKYVDMNSIPSELDGKHDFCWSVCALEHLGSIEKGLKFVSESLRVLKPGGVAVHTTEFNYTNEEETIDNWPTVIFQRKHFEQLGRNLREAGHEPVEFDFNPGNGVFDRFVDVPPYSWGQGWLSKEMWQVEGGAEQEAHLKLSLDGFPCTCIGIIVRKKAEASNQ